MTQAKHPTFDEIQAWANYVRIDLARSPEHQSEEELLDARIVCRVYDRRSGNFKAMGWLVRLQYGSAFSGRNYPIVMLDSELARSKLT